MVSLSPLTMRIPERLQSSPQQGAQPETYPVEQSKAALNGALSRFIRQSSYWVKEANEMAAVNTILIIVNWFAP